MSDAIRWALFHTFENELPTNFFEVRQHREMIWTCTGRTKTFGESDVTGFGSVALAEAAFEQLASDARGRGLIEVAAGIDQPGEFDFEALEAAVKTASRKTFEVMRAVHGEQLAGFALLTDPDPMTIVGVGQSEAAIARADEEDQLAARWFVGEWSLDDGDAHFDIPYRMILRQSRGDIPFEQQIDDELFASGCFEAFVAALEALRLEGLFERSGAGPLVLLVNVSDDDEIESMAERLNPDPAMLDAYHSVMG